MHQAKLFAKALSGALLALGLAASASGQCQLNSPSGKLKHVVYIEFDNVHFTRDNPNVPSDLEQMPNLLNFITKKGTLDAGDHTVLISHTANDILTTETGLYSDHTSIFIANSFGVYEPGGGFVDFPSAFFYWTDTVENINKFTQDNNFALVTPSGANVPAPWVPFTRAGCDVGAFSTANIVLERTPFDVIKVFGAGSQQAMETSGAQFNDFVGAAIHCAIGSPFCAASDSVVPVADSLPDEPGGYNGYQALFGLKYVAPALGGLSDYSGNAITGFNDIGFDPTPAQSLAVVETMLKKGIPIVFAYIADAHDNHEGAALSAEQTFGPGEAPYVKQLSDYNAAFGTFFANLKAAGIDETNTLFIFTPDEGDHFVGGTPSPANCDGITVPCTYGTGGVGEVQYDLRAAVIAAGNTTPFTYHFDDAATSYVIGNPSQDSATVRQLEQTMGGLSAVNPHTGQSESLLGLDLGPDLRGAMVDQTGQKLLHMSSSVDPARNPTFTMFGNPNFFFTPGPKTPKVGTGFAWNHGDIQPEIARTFIGIVGPGVSNLGVTGPRDFFTDHVDLRPTLIFLSGLTDDYQHDGRVILELLDPQILPDNLRSQALTLDVLGQVYKQINAPFGALAKDTLKVSTHALLSNSPGDATYTALNAKIAAWTTKRDALAARIQAILDGAEFNGRRVNEPQAFGLIGEGLELLFSADECAEHPGLCAQF